MRTLVTEGVEAVNELVTAGMRFDRDPSGAIEFGREGGHGQHRVLHTDGAATGRELVRWLGGSSPGRPTSGSSTTASRWIF